VTTPEFNDQVEKLSLEERRILAKSLAQQLGISVTGLGPSFIKIF
jgi:hypothetical protein